jgi:hypothetical protein
MMNPRDPRIRYAGRVLRFEGITWHDWIASNDSRCVHCKTRIVGGSPRPVCQADTTLEACSEACARELTRFLVEERG